MERIAMIGYRGRVGAPAGPHPRRVRSACLPGFALLLSFLPVALAAQQDAEPSDTLPRYHLAGVTVTATRQPVSRDALPQRVEVVTRADLERTPAVELADVLKTVVGVDVIQFPALLSSISIRGFRPTLGGTNPRTLVLVDGRPAGATNLATLGLASVERVEVLKGPASALYGSSAMGGVVNVVTPRSAGAVHSRASAAYGSFQTWEGRLASGGSLGGGVDFDLSLGALERNAGYRLGSHRWVGSEVAVKTLADGSTQRLPDVHGDSVLAFSEQGYRTGSLRVGYAPGDAWRVDARAGVFVAGGVQNPGDLNVTLYGTRSVNDLERYTGDLALSGSLGRHAPLLRAYANRETTTYYEGVAPPEFVNLRTPVETYGGQLQDMLALGAHTLTVGADYAVVAAASERYTGPGEPAPAYAPGSEVSSTAAFAQGRLTWLDERLVATVGARLDHIAFEVDGATLFDGSRVSPNTETHTVFNPSAGLQYTTPDGLHLHASGGRAFVTPDAFNVAGYSERSAGPGAVAIAHGNAGLRPERSVSWDAGAGLVRRERGVDLDVTYFHTDVTDRISPVLEMPTRLRLSPAGDTVLSITTYRNVDRARIRGLEARAGYDFGALADHRYSLRLFAGGTRFLSAVETSGQDERRIPNVADLNLSFGAEYDDLRRFHARITGRYVGDRIDADFTDFLNPGDVQYPAFLVLGLGGGARLGDRYRLGITVANLADENYYEVRGYTLPGRSLKLELGVEF